MVLYHQALKTRTDRPNPHFRVYSHGSRRSRSPRRRYGPRRSRTPRRSNRSMPPMRDSSKHGSRRSESRDISPCSRPLRRSRSHSSNGSKRAASTSPVKKHSSSHHAAEPLNDKAAQSPKAAQPPEAAEPPRAVQQPSAEMAALVEKERSANGRCESLAKENDVCTKTPYDPICMPPAITRALPSSRPCAIMHCMHRISSN